MLVYILKLNFHFNLLFKTDDGNGNYIILVDFTLVFGNNNFVSCGNNSIGDSSQITVARIIVNIQLDIPSH